MPFDPGGFAAVASVALLGGFAGALLGLGGAVIITPILTGLMGFPLRSVIGANLVAVIATSSGAAASYVKDRITNLRVAMFLEMATTTGALLGASLSALLPLRWLYWLFSALLAYSAFSMFQRRRLEGAAEVPDSRLARWLGLQGEYRDPALGQTVAYRAGRVVPGFLVMVAAGGLGGVLGIGAGLFKVLAMDVLMGLPIKVSTATSNFMIGVTAAAGAGVYFARGEVDPAVAAPVALGVLTGAWLGSLVLPGLRGRWIRYAFVPLLVYLAVQMAWRGAAL